MRTLIIILFVGVLIFSGTVFGQEDDTPEPPFLTINEVEDGNTTENTIYRVELEENQVVLLVLQQIFDACLQVTALDGDILIEDSDVVEYGSVVLIPFVPPQTGVYELLVGNFRCDPFERERTFLLYVVERDFPELSTAPTETRARHTESLMTGELEAGTRYRLIIEAEEDLPSFRTLRIAIAQSPYYGLNDSFSVSMSNTQYAEYIFEADATGIAIFNMTYRQPNPGITEGIDPIDVTLTLEEVTE